VTIALEEGLAVGAVGTELEQRGFLLNFRSRHMLARNWIQISLLGDPPRAWLQSLLPVLRSMRVCRASPQGALEHSHHS
jgi:hypothetical protein